MKKPLLILAAVGTLVAAVAVPNQARAGQVSLNIHIGVPGVPAYRPHVVYEPVVYQPVIAYRPRAICPPPAVHYRPAYYEHRYNSQYRGAYASAYPSYGGGRRIAEVQVNPRLGR
jgi:hypothetical protein